MPNPPVLLPRDVRQGIEAVRLTGRTNMLDRRVVADIADELGFHHAATWIRENRDLYARAIFHGFDTVEADSTDPSSHQGDYR